MTRQQMTDAIIASIQDDAKLLQMMRLLIATNLSNVSDDKILSIYTALGLTQ